MKKFLLLLSLIFFHFLNAQKNVFPASRASLIDCMAPFYHGVASGDPLADKVILWTRITPDSSAASDSLLIHWRIALDTGMTFIVNNGSVYTNSEKDFTVKVDADGLSPDTYYYYDFEHNNNHSIRGRTKTAPAGDNDTVRFAVVSCLRYEEGFFNSFNRIVNRNNVDAIICLGDYIYEEEYDGIEERLEHVEESVTLADYKARYFLNRLDPDLMLAHQQFPWICIWDDHEIANDAYQDGAENHQSNEGTWDYRKGIATKVYFDWMPVRRPSISDTTQIYRKINYGNLLNLYMLDTRIEGRSKQVSSFSFSLYDVDRKIISDIQYNWLLNEMKTSSAKWNILGQQVMMAPLEMLGFLLNKDQWDDYPVQRQQLYTDILANNIKNLVVLTGDIHTSWANDLPGTGYNSTTGVGSIGVEFVGPSVTSKGFPLGFAGSAIQAANGHIKYADVTNHGYMLVDVNKQRTQCDWFFVDDIENPSTTENWATSFYVNANERFLRIAGAAAQVQNGKYYHTEAPPCPIVNSTSTFVNGHQRDYVLIESYPNPSSDQCNTRIFVNEPTEISISVYNGIGQLMYFNREVFPHGINTIRTDLGVFSEGVYQLVLQSSYQSISHPIIKQ